MKEVKETGTTKEGYRYVILFVNGSHHCGYVSIGRDHPFFGIDYDTPIKEFAEQAKKVEIGKKSSFVVFSAMSDEYEVNPSPSVLIDVHGGLTFASNGSKDYPIESSEDDWWFGFDCAHAGDLTMRDGSSQFAERGDVFRDVDYVREECFSMSAQLAAYQEETK